ncbi:MAG: sporulation protein [Bacteroidota bacterium]
MFGKVKRWLGIEGVKLELILPEGVRAADGLIEGRIRLTSMDEHRVTGITVLLVERYSRGRKDNKLTDEYELGKIELEQDIEIPAEEAIEVEFQLPFEMMKSDMDQLQDRNILLGGVVKAAKWMSGVRSAFRVEAEARVAGTALNPFDKKTILVK